MCCSCTRHLLSPCSSSTAAERRGAQSSGVHDRVPRSAQAEQRGWAWKREGVSSGVSGYSQLPAGDCLAVTRRLFSDDERHHIQQRQYTPVCLSAIPSTALLACTLYTRLHRLCCRHCLLLLPSASLAVRLCASVWTRTTAAAALYCSAAWPTPITSRCRRRRRTLSQPTMTPLSSSPLVSSLPRLRPASLPYVPLLLPALSLLLLLLSLSPRALRSVADSCESVLCLR